MNDFAAFSHTVATLVATYFVHSTLLLATCWLLLTVARAKSHFLAERMWKLAAVLGFVTAFAQLAVGPITFPNPMLSSTRVVVVDSQLDEIASVDSDVIVENMIVTLDTSSEWQRHTSVEFCDSGNSEAVLPINKAFAADVQPPVDDSIAILTPLDVYAADAPDEIFDATVHSEPDHSNASTTVQASKHVVVPNFRTPDPQENKVRPLLAMQLQDDVVLAAVQSFMLKLAVKRWYQVIFR